MRAVRFGPLRIVAPPGVYVPRSDTAMLAAQMGPVRGAAVLELCAGSGAVALTAAHAGAARTVTVDRSARAVLAVRVNARLNGLTVDARRGDLLDALGPGERFDVILANPPYLPAVGTTDALDHRWDAGLDGRDVLDRIIRGAGTHLRPGGRLVLVQSDLAGVAVTEAMLAHHGLLPGGRVEHRGPLGPIAAARREALVRRGVLEAGSDEELMAVVSGIRPVTRLAAVLPDAAAA